MPRSKCRDKRESEYRGAPLPTRVTMMTSRIGAAALVASIAIGASFAMPSAPAAGAPPTSKKKTDKKKKPKPDKKKAVAQKKKPPPPPPLDGTTLDYDYDGKADGHPERRWHGRVFAHKRALAMSGYALPVLVFLHGTNAEKIKYRWMGGGQEGDVRRILSEMMDAGLVPPMLVAAPSSIDPNTIVNAGLSWPAFDLDNFLDKTAERLGTTAIIDPGRVVVAAHSGGGCNIKGGLASALRAKRTPVLAGFSIDTCMLFDLAKELAHARSNMHVVVSWQSLSWEREFTGFRTFFLREVKKAPPVAPGVLRELYYEPQPGGSAHDAMVGHTLRKYLPRVLGPAPITPETLDAGAGPPMPSDGG